MAHFCLIVVTGPAEAVADAMAPFNSEARDGAEPAHWVFVPDRHADVDTRAGRRGYWRNPQGKWDGWVTGGNWWGLLGDGPWGQESYAEADYDRVNRCRGDEIGQRLLGRPERLAEVHALLAGGVWSGHGDFGSAGAWRAALRGRLDAVPAEAVVSVLDCHC
jgi:hypothetical protein